MTPKCKECGRKLGSAAGVREGCELCWHAAMERREELRQIEIDRKIDEARGK